MRWIWLYISKIVNFIKYSYRFKHNEMQTAKLKYGVKDQATQLN